MRRICHIVDVLSIGGLEKNLVSICLGSRRYEHAVYCLREEGCLAEQLRQAGIPMQVFHFSGRLRLRSLRILAASLRQLRPEAVHCHGLYPSIWGRVAGCMAGVPVRLDHVQNVYDDVGLKDRIKLRLLATVTSRCIAVSRAVADCLTDCIGIDRSLIEIIYNSSADMRVQGRGPGREEIRQRYGVKPQDMLVGCVGRLERHKGHRHVIDALQLCRQQGVSCKVMIVGEGPAAQELRGQAQRLGWGQEVIFTAAVLDVGQYLRAMDVFVQPSTLREGLPLALAEAASACLPLLATPVGGNAEIVLDGSNGFIFDVNDVAGLANRLCQLAADAGLRSRLGIQSRALWERIFSQQSMIAAVEKLYDEQISKHHYS